MSSKKAELDKAEKRCDRLLKSQSGWEIVRRTVQTQIMHLGCSQKCCHEYQRWHIAKLNLAEMALL